jgi:hypothetical protein
MKWLHRALGWLALLLLVAFYVAFVVGIATGRMHINP